MHCYDIGRNDLSDLRSNRDRPRFHSKIAMKLNPRVVFAGAGSRERARSEENRVRTQLKGVMIRGETSDSDPIHFRDPIHFGRQ